MTSDLMPSPESSNSNVQEQAETTKIVTPAKDNASSQASELENSSALNSDANEQNLASRQQPIPPPSEPMQYRAIGLVRGRYLPSSEQFTQGTMLTADGTLLDAVLLGRIMSLVKNHLDLGTDHLWVVYPRTRQENDTLHLQIVGVWEPEKLAKNQTTDEQQALASQENQSSNDSVENSADTTTFIPSSELTDGGFSVRGEIVYQSYDAGSMVIKIKQAPRKDDDKPKYFKLKLTGRLETKAVGKFWDMQVKRQGDALVIEHAEAIADLPKKRKPPFKKGQGGGGGRRPGGNKPYPKRSGETPLPIKKTGDSPAPPPRPKPKGSIPMPVKRQKPPEQ